MKRLLSIAIAAISLMVVAVSCGKDSIIVSRYGFDKDEIGQLNFVTGHEEDAQAFISDLNAVTARFDGTEFTEGELVAAYDEVVNRHNNKYIWGTFSLYKLDNETGAKVSAVKTWTMVNMPG